MSNHIKLASGNLIQGKQTALSGINNKNTADLSHYSSLIAAS